MKKYLLVLTLILRWQMNSHDEQGVYVFRSLHNQNNYQLIATLPPKSSTYTDKNIKRNTKVCYYVSAFTNSIRSNSNEYCAKNP